MEVFLLTLFIVDWHVQIIFASVLLLFESLTFSCAIYLDSIGRLKSERNISKVRETRKILAILYEVNEE